MKATLLQCSKCMTAQITIAIIKLTTTVDVISTLADGNLANTIMRIQPMQM